jgi:hypothetical protein
MKPRIKSIFILTVILLVRYQSIQSQNNADDIIFKAMTDELNRNIEKLQLNTYKPPFFLGYRLSYTKRVVIEASLGSLVQSEESIGKTPNVRLMIGDYSLNDENFVGGSRRFSSGGGYLPLPLDNDYNAIRRAFWIMSDQTYKSAIESYEQKLTALKQQNREENEKPDDFSKIQPINLSLQNIPFVFDKDKWESTIKNLSAVFKGYSKIISSSVVFYFVNGSFYYLTNEGTKIKFPGSIVCLLVNANAQADDGEQLRDHLLYYALTPEQLPSVEKIKNDINQMATNIIAMCNAPVFNDSYSGPVIFEDEAVAELFVQKLFGSNGLIASREPVYAVQRQEQGRINKFDNKINQRICSANIDIKATPKLKFFNNIPLVGTFDVDAEGVMPNEEMVLVERGILKTLLNDRVPTSKVKESNGYCRLTIGGSTQKAPGVINVSYSNGSPLDSVRRKAMAEAEKDGLDYIYIIRKVEVLNIGMNQFISQNDAKNLPLSKPVSIYKVAVKTGKEELVRSALISDFPIISFKYISQGTKEQIVYNTLMRGNVPVSFIVPRALVFNDISIEKDKSTRPKLPLVPNPLVTQK